MLDWYGNYSVQCNLWYFKDDLIQKIRDSRILPILFGMYDVDFFSFEIAFDRANSFYKLRSETSFLGVLSLENSENIGCPLRCQMFQNAHFVKMTFRPRTHEA